MTDDIQNKKSEDDIEEIKSQLLEAEKKCEEYLAGWKRAAADYQNLQKDVARDREIFVKFATERLVFDILPALDHARDALKQIPSITNNQEAPWIAGIKHVFLGLKSILRQHGLEEIKIEIGEKFNPETHEAVGVRKEEGKEADLILEEVRSGYLLVGKILRPAQVIISE